MSGEKILISDSILSRKKTPCVSPASHLRYKDPTLCLLLPILVKTLDVAMDLLILSFGELSETNMVRIVMIMNFISFLAEC